MQMESLQDLYVEELRDLYSAENQLLKALPKMAKAANNQQLQQAFAMHTDQTREHVQRLERIFDKLGQKAKGKKCKGMEGLVEEGKEMMQDADDDDVMDASL